MDINLIKLLINNKAVSAYAIEKETGVNRSNINKIRNGERKFENLTLESLEKLQGFIDKFPPSISYDYEDLIKELEEDVGYNEFLIFERKRHSDIDYWAVVDWHFNLEEVTEIKDGHKLTVERVESVLEEMREMNRI